MGKDIRVLNDTRDALHDQMRRYKAGEADADSCGKVGFLGAATAYAISVKHKLKRAEKQAA